MCLISWQRTQKRDPHKLFWGDFWVKKGVPNGHFPATRSLVIVLLFLPLENWQNFAQTFHVCLQQNHLKREPPNSICQGRFLAERMFCFADFVAGCFLLVFVGRSAQKNPRENPRQILQNLQEKNRHISAELPGQHLGAFFFGLFFYYSQKRPLVHNSLSLQFFLEGLFAILAECSQFCSRSF